MNKEMQEKEIVLGKLLKEYQKNDAMAKSLKERMDSQNKQIKDLMKELGYKSFITKDVKGTVSYSQRETLNESLMIPFLKGKEVKGVIKTKEYVDLVQLENAIYNGIIKAEELKPFQTIKEVVTLKVQKV